MCSTDVANYNDVTVIFIFVSDITWLPFYIFIYSYAHNYLLLICEKFSIYVLNFDSDISFPLCFFLSV